jgi:uncharacterized protein YbbC (DUF1343 family)
MMKRCLSILSVVLSVSCIAQSGTKDILPADATPATYMPLLQHKRIALVANQTSQVGDSLLVDMLMARKMAVVRILVPEHGFRGREDAGAKIGNSVDSATKLPVISLYGEHKKPKPEDLADVDVVVYDLQDVGVRFYTYISTLQYVMEACIENHKQLIILDRPNPNGFYVDGPVLEAEQKSFVGMQAIPVVYGMTAGEYAGMLVGEGWVNGGRSLDMKIIPCINYDHRKKYSLPVAPSPNLRNMAAVYAYPSLCLFEGTPVSVGRGTELPFQQYGCPEFVGKYTYTFTPKSGAGAKNPPHEGKVCYGEVIGKNENDVLAAINNHMRLHWLIKAYNAYPDKEKFFTAFFTKLSGTTKLQQQIRSGASEAEIWQSWQKDLEAFKKIRSKYLLYAD